MANTYTDEQRTEAVALFDEHGATKAAAAIGCTRETIYQWVRQASSTDTQKEPDEIAADERYQHRLRTTLRRRILTAANDIMDRIYEPHIDFKVTKEGVETVTYPTARSGDVKNYVTSAAILLDKFRLEMGESTDRVEGKMTVEVNGVDVSTVK